MTVDFRNDEIHKDGVVLSSGKEASFVVSEDNVIIFSNNRNAILEKDCLDVSCEEIVNNEGETVYQYIVKLRPINAFVLRFAFRGKKINISRNHAEKLTTIANTVPMAKATLSDNKKHIVLTVPFVSEYREITKALNAYPTKDGHQRILSSRALDLEILNDSLENYPKIVISDDVKKLTSEKIDGFDGTVESLKTIPIDVLNVVKNNNQSYRALSKSKKTLAEKFASFGIVSLYDLMTFLPRKYIDKSSPQDIRSYSPGESATIIGTVHRSEFMPRNMGVRFIIETESGDRIPAIFWRQNWLKQKFPKGSEIVLTGKVDFFRRQISISGSSIELAKEASILPIVPVYKQSESKGITTNLIFLAVREMFSRLGSINLPDYLEKEGRIDYYEAFKEIHIPSTLSNHKKIVNALAYYELVYLQLLIQDAKNNESNRSGIAMRGGELQEKAAKNLPFTLTNSQRRAVDFMNEKMASEVPASVLLNADVGAGKTIVAQLSCLRAVDSGFQAALLAPTDVLAQQLFSTLSTLVASLDNVHVAYLSGSLKAAEKKKVLKGIADGTVNIVVGTVSMLSNSVKFKNLGFVAVDEQQKFGAEQRTQLLTSREDGLIPDILMQTATPIPRSAAQIFYGDIDMILLDEKPPGRLPIKTVWIKETPCGLFNGLAHELWDDIKKEAEKGNQTFVIAPMIKESEKVDVSSVEGIEKDIQSILPDLSIGIVHGQMKKDQQETVMNDFRNKKFDVLVASTVVEVGVDIPDATRMVIMSAERLGASSLHQIRGRIGRNSKPSICYLVSPGTTENSVQRLTSLVENEDGFSIAKDDLLTRGEGTLFGANQSGVSDLMFASLATHGQWIEKAKNEARDILSSTHKEEALDDARTYFSPEGRLI